MFSAVKLWFQTSKFAPYILVAIGVALYIGYVMYQIRSYGSEQYDSGVTATEGKQKDAVIETLQTDAKIWKDVKHENSKIKDRAAAAAALGILRDDKDR